MTELLAQVWLRPPQTFSVHTRPGRRLNFLYGHADIWIEDDLQYVLNMPNAVVRAEPKYAEMLDQVLWARDELHPTFASLDLGEGVVIPASEHLQHLRECAAHLADSVDLIVQTVAGQPSPALGTPPEEGPSSSSRLADAIRRGRPPKE